MSPNCYTYIKEVGNILQSLPNRSKTQTSPTSYVSRRLFQYSTILAELYFNKDLTHLSNTCFDLVQPKIFSKSGDPLIHAYFEHNNFRDVTPCGLTPTFHKNLLTPSKFLYTDWNCRRHVHPNETRTPSRLYNSHVSLRNSIIYRRMPLYYVFITTNRLMCTFDERLGF